MIRRVLALLLTAGLLMAMIPVGALAEDELFFSPNDPVQEKNDADKSELDELKDLSAAIMEALGKKDWEALAEKVSLTGNWRSDLVKLAESQLGYQEEKDGMTLYTRWAGKEEATEWSALFVNWVAEKIGLDAKEFPQGTTYSSLRSRMNDLKAVKKISRSSYPTSGDLALIETSGQKLVGIVVYVSNDYASVIHGGDNGRVTKETYQVGGREFKNYIDLNVLMERAGIEVGKGGVVPVIPEGGIAAWTNTNAVYMRSEPTTASKSLTTVKKARTALLVTSAEMQEDGYIWYGVKYKQYEGFIRGDLLELDLAAIPTVTPIPEKKPESTPAAGCVHCAKASMGLALPVECCYEHLASMSIDEAAAFLKALLMDDTATFVLYVSCAASHVKAGDDDLLCLGKECGMAAWSRPSVLHDENCPWHKPGLASQERVVNLAIREARKGQEIMISFEIYGASTYQWHEVKTVVNADGSVTETDNIMSGENAASVIVTARDEANTTYSYYCVATISANGSIIEVASKETVLSVESATVAAKAILGEEVNFTYENNRAAGYQWYVKADELSDAVAIAADDAFYTGANSAKLTFYADVHNAGALYYCVALNANGSEVGRSSYYQYRFFLGTPDVTTCEGHDLCRYVAELANMTREERYVALNQTWFVSAEDLTTVTIEDDCISEYVMWHWYLCHADRYPNLICTCTPTDENLMVYHPYNDVHEAECPWYVEPAEDGETAAVRREDQDEYDKWVVTATPEMIARAQQVPTLDHVYFEKNTDGTYDVYVVRYPEPVGKVDVNGYMTYGDPVRVIAWVDFTTGVVYPVDSLPAVAPAYTD